MAINVYRKEQFNNAMNVGVLIGETYRWDKTSLVKMSNKPFDLSVAHPLMLFRHSLAKIEIQHYYIYLNIKY